MYFLCVLQQYIANRTSWVPRLTVLDSQTNWTYEHAVGMELIHIRGAPVIGK